MSIMGNPASHLQKKSRLYGRRKGRPLRARKSMLMQDLLPKLQIELPSPPPLEGGVRGGGAMPSFSFGLRDAPPPILPRKGGGTRLGLLDPRSLFSPEVQSIWLEIGFGGGEHLAVQAEKYPNDGFIGCEPFVNGIASLLDHIDRKQLKNIRIYPGDARLLLDTLPDASLARCVLLFPDPWPKARHAERRFIGPENLQRLARVLKEGAELRIATDDEQLKDWMREHLRGAEDFELIGDSTARPADWPPTRYEEKALKAGRKPVYLEYTRVFK
jgi:tRNA (guanine-N7-)-methyltransferase